MIMLFRFLRRYGDPVTPNVGEDIRKADLCNEWSVAGSYDVDTPDEGCSVEDPHALDDDGLFEVTRRRRGLQRLAAITDFAPPGCVTKILSEQTVQ